MSLGLLTWVIVLALAGPAVAQELWPTLEKIRETGAIQLGYRETSRPFSFTGPDGRPTSYSIDLCLQVAAAVRQHLKLPDLKMDWVAVTPAVRVASSRGRSISSADRPPSPSTAWSRSHSAT